MGLSASAVCHAAAAGARQEWSPLRFVKFLDSELTALHPDVTLVPGADKDRIAGSLGRDEMELLVATLKRCMGVDVEAACRGFYLGDIWYIHNSHPITVGVKKPSVVCVRPRL